MSSVNKVILLGNLGKDPEVRTIHNGGKVASFSIATTEKWADKNTQETRERTEWHKVVIWSGKLIEVVERYLQKGSKVYVEGQARTRKWQDQQENDRWITEVVIANPWSGTLKLLDKAPAKDTETAAPTPPSQTSRGSPPITTTNYPRPETHGASVPASDRQGPAGGTVGGDPKPPPADDYDDIPF